MNSGLKRIATSRGRLIHRSKNIERRVLVMPSGAELVLGMAVSEQRGETFNAGISAAKREGWSKGAVRGLKAGAWNSLS